METPLHKRVFSALGLCWSAARDDQSRHHILPWIASMLQRGNSLSFDRPWLPFRVIDWLSATLTGNMSVFEFGAGASTLFFARRVAAVVSVEHDPVWHKNISEVLTLADAGNCTLHFIPPTEASVSHPGRDTAQYRSAVTEYKEMSFFEYVKAIDACAAGSLDLVSIDGRARIACLMEALPKIRSGGYVLLDDSERPRYRQAENILSKYKRIDFSGLCPYINEWRYTTVWQKA